MSGFSLISEEVKKLEEENKSLRALVDVVQKINGKLETLVQNIIADGYEPKNGTLLGELYVLKCKYEKHKIEANFESSPKVVPERSSPERPESRSSEYSRSQNDSPDEACMHPICELKEEDEIMVFDADPKNVITDDMDDEEEEKELTDNNFKPPTKTYLQVVKKEPTVTNNFNKIADVVSATVKVEPPTPNEDVIQKSLSVMRAAEQKMKETNLIAKTILNNSTSHQLTFNPSSSQLSASTVTYSKKSNGAEVIQVPLSGEDKQRIIMKQTPPQLQLPPQPQAQPQPVQFIATPQIRIATSNDTGFNYMSAILNATVKAAGIQLAPVQSAPIVTKTNSTKIIVKSPDDLPQQAARPKRHKCTWAGCDMAFYEKYKLLRHFRTHTGEKPFECHYQGCNQRYSRKENLTTHINNVHKLRNITLYTCEVQGCYQSFASKDVFDQHLQTHFNS